MRVIKSTGKFKMIRNAVIYGVLNVSLLLVTSFIGSQVVGSREVNAQGIELDEYQPTLQETPPESQVESFDVKVDISVGQVGVYSENKDFKTEEIPTFDLATGTAGGFKGIGQTITRLFSGKDHEVKLEITYAGPDDVMDGTPDDLGVLVDETTINYENAPDNYMLNTDKFRPGKYTLKATDVEKGTSIEQDFTWGVLAINTNKSIYPEGETARFAIGVLDETGEMVCDAKVDLVLQDPNGGFTTLSTQDGSIIVNETCSAHRMTKVPDYESQLENLKSGTYFMELTAETQNGSYTITDTFEVRAPENLDFDIERITGTRIYPLIEYPAVFKIIPKNDFSGILEDIVPGNFKVSEVDSNRILEDYDISADLETGLVYGPEILMEDNQQYVRWQVDWKAGQEYYLGYKFDAPDESPEFYLLGKLSVWAGEDNNTNVFNESRSWQLAIDPVPSGIIIAWDGTAASIPSPAWQRITSLDTYFIRGTTGTPSASELGSASHTHSSPNHTHLIGHNHTGSATTGGSNGTGVATKNIAGGSAEEGHTHSVTVSINSGESNNGQTLTLATQSNNPPYKEVIWIQSNGTAEIPNGGIAFYNSNTLPTSWTRTGNSKYLKGAAASSDPGADGGSSSHSHTESGSHTHTENSHTHTATIDGTASLQSNGDNKATSISQYVHSHTASGGGTTATESGNGTAATVATTSNIDPPFYTLNTLKNNTGGSETPSNIIALWVGSVASIPPTWDICDGADPECPNMNGYFSKAANVDGDLGVNANVSTHSHAAGNTHTHPINSHTHTYTVGADGTGGYGPKLTGTNGAPSTHSHALGITGTATTGTATVTANTENHVPLYKEAVFIRKLEVLTVSGTCKQYDGVSDCVDDGTNEIAVAVNGTKAAVVDTVVDGSWTMEIATMPTLNDPVVIYIDKESNANERANAITVYSAGDINGVQLIQRHVTVGSSQNTTVDNTDFESFDYDLAESATEPGIFFNVDSANDLTVDPNTVYSDEELRITAGDTYQPDSGSSGNVTTHDFHIDSTGIFTADSNTINVNGDLSFAGTYTAGGSTTNVAGNWTNTGTFTANTSIVNFTGNATAHQTVTTNAQVFNTLTLNNTQGTFDNVIISGNLDVNGVFTVTDGVLDINTNDPGIYTSNNVSIGTNGSINTGTGAWIFDVVGTKTLTDSSSSGPQNFGDVSLLSGTSTPQLNLGSSVKFETLTITGTHTLNLGNSGYTLELAGDGASASVLTNAGTLTPGTSTVKYTAVNSGGNVFVAATTYNSLQVAASSGSEIYDMTGNLSGANHITGNLTIGANSTLDTTNNNYALEIQGNWNNTGTFTVNSSTVTFDFPGGGTATIDGTLSGASSFYNVVFNHASGEWSISSDMTVDNDFTITSAQSLDMSGIILTVKGNFGGGPSLITNGSTVVLAGAGGTIQSVTGSTSFYNLVASTTPTRAIEIASGTTQTIAADGDLDLRGQSCDNLLILRSSSSDTAYTLTRTTGGTGTTTLSYIDVQDATATNALTASNSVDSGGNTSWTIAANACIGASTNDSASRFSFQRKTFYDVTNTNQWLFYGDGNEIEPRYSSDDGSTWDNATWDNDYATNDFSIWNDTISSTDYVWLVAATNNDIVVRRGTLGASSITWESNEIVALNGTGASDTYSYPVVTVDHASPNQFIWVGARHFDGTNYSFEATKSDFAASVVSGSWPSMTFGTSAQLSDDQTNANVYGNIVPLASGDVYATFVTNVTLEGCIYDSVTDSRWEDSAGAICNNGGAQDAIDTVQPGITKTLSAVSDGTHYDVHLLYAGSSPSNQISYKRWDNGTVTWDATAVQLVASNTASYPTLSANSTNHDLKAYWIDTATNYIVERFCDNSEASQECSTAADWAASSNLVTTGTNTHLNSSYEEINQWSMTWNEGTSMVTVSWNKEQAAVTVTYTQNDFEWFVSEATVTLTNIWPSGGGDNIGENTAIEPVPSLNEPPDIGDRIRIQMSFTVGDAILASGTLGFRLEYDDADDCTTAAGWLPVGGTADVDKAWRLYDESTIGPSTTQVNQISTSTAGAEGLFSETNPTGNNPNTVSIGQNSEWDWPVENYSATPATNYCFRMVKGGGSEFDVYNADSYPKLATAPAAGNLLRHGNIFVGGEEKGFFWTE